MLYCTLLNTYIINYLTNLNFIIFRKIRNDVEATDPDLKLSRSSVSRRLKKADLSAKTPRSVPYKTRAHRLHRVQWGKDNKDRTEREWNE